MSELPEIAAVASSYQEGGLQTELEIDRDKAARLGVTQAAIDDALYDAFGQRLISTIFTQSAQYRVVLEADRSYTDNLQALRSIHVKTQSGNLVPIGDLAQISETNTMLSVQRLGQFPATTEIGRAHV